MDSASRVAFGLAFFTIAVGLSGCGPSPSPSPSPTPAPSPGPGVVTTTTTTNFGLTCSSDVNFEKFTRMADKGIVLDDISYLDCAEQLFDTWPNTAEKISMIRTNAPWRNIWARGAVPEEVQAAAMKKLTNFILKNNLKVLVGQDATCNVTADDIQWKHNLEFMKNIGVERIIGLAIGNEMDILYTHTDWWEKAFPNCMLDMWDQNRAKSYWKQFQGYVSSMETDIRSSDIRWTQVPVTSVWTAGFAIAGPGQPPFFESPGKALVRTFVHLAFAKYGKRWVWTFNPYPIWAGPYGVDKDDKGSPIPQQCNKAIALAKGPIAANMIAITRRAIKTVTGNNDDLMWAGEYGWTSPKSAGMDKGIFKDCDNFTSLQTFSGYYEHFLDWDLTLKEASGTPTAPEDRKLVGVDKVFFFTMRNAFNGGASEYFGLIDKCGDAKCKIHKTALAADQAAQTLAVDRAAQTLVVSGSIFQQFRHLPLIELLRHSSSYFQQFRLMGAGMSTLWLRPAGSREPTAISEPRGTWTKAHLTDTMIV